MAVLATEPLDAGVPPHIAACAEAAFLAVTVAEIQAEDVLAHIEASAEAGPQARNVLAHNIAAALAGYAEAEPQAVDAPVRNIAAAHMALVAHAEAEPAATDARAHNIAVRVVLVERVTVQPCGAKFSAPEPAA